MPRRWQLTVNGELRSLPRIADFIAEAGHGAGLDEDALFAIELACDEACCNVIEHAYSQASGPIHVICMTDRADFVVQVVDFGRAFDPKAVKGPLPTEKPEDVQAGGFGMLLMRRMMDVVAYEFDAHNGNRLTMIKRGVVPQPGDDN